MALPPEQVLAGYQATVAAVRARLVQLATMAWTGLGSYRDADIDRLVALLVPRVQAGQLQVAALTAAYLTALAGEDAAETAAGALVAREAILTARGVPPEQVYRRPAQQLYVELSRGAVYEAAAAAGLSRLTSIVVTDLQMAKVRQADASLRRTGARYYRRVLHGSDNCAKCIITSTRRYRVGQLMPVHPGCDCGVAAVNSSDPPPVLDHALLDATHEQVKTFAGKKFANAAAADYQDLIVTHEHGEIGPVLAWRGQHFRGPADL